MNLIELGKEAVLSVQKRFGLANYGMVNLSWVFGIAVGVLTTQILHWIFSLH